MLTLKQRVSRYLNSVSKLSAPSTVQLYTERLNQFLAFVGSKEVTADLVNEWTAECLKRGLSNTTVASYRTTVVSFATAIGVKFGNEHRFSIQATPKEKTVFTDEGIERILAVSKGHWPNAIRLALATALRLGDIACLEWSSILWDRKGIRLVPNKTKRRGKVAEIPLSDEILTMLISMEKTGPYVFPEMQSQYAADGHKTLSMEFIRIVRKAGVNGSFHQMRRSAITKWLVQGISPALISSVTGQSLAVLMGYLRPTLETKRELFCK